MKRLAFAVLTATPLLPLFAQSARGTLRHLAAEIRATPPTPVTAALLANGSFDQRHVRLTGTVWDARTSETNPNWSLLTIADKTGITLASLCNDPKDKLAPEALLGADIQLDGVCIPRELGKGVRKHLGRTVKAFGRKAIRVLRPPAGTTDEIPDIGTLSDASTDEIPRLEKHRVVGTVIAAWDRQALLTTTNGTVVTLDVIKGDPPTPGQHVQAVGFPETDLFHLILTRAIWTESPHSPPHDGQASRPSPLSLTDVPETALITKRILGKTVTLSGTLLTLPRQEDARRFAYVARGNTILPVYIGHLQLANPKITAGCRVEVTGIGILDAERWSPGHTYPRVKGVFVVMRSPDDIRLLEHAPWWTPRRLTVVIGSLLVLLLGIAVWNGSLRRIAARKGRELMREQLEHVKAELKAEERTRLAVELHDSLAQNLTGVALEIDTAVKLADEDASSMSAHLGIAARSLKACRDELRNCLWDLRNRALETATMDAAIRQTLAPHTADADVVIRFNVAREQISDSSAHAILCIIRELSLNAIRHGKATKIRIAGSIDGERMLFSVRDNGCGFDPDNVPGFAEGHYGLLGIRERIDKFEGAFSLSSQPGKGTKATVSLNVPQETRRDRSPQDSQVEKES